MRTLWLFLLVLLWDPTSEAAELSHEVLASIIERFRNLTDIEPNTSRSGGQFSFLMALTPDQCIGREPVSFSPSGDGGVPIIRGNPVHFLRSSFPNYIAVMPNRSHQCSESKLLHVRGETQQDQGQERGQDQDCRSRNRDSDRSRNSDRNRNRDSDRSRSSIRNRDRNRRSSWSRSRSGDIDMSEGSSRSWQDQNQGSSPAQEFQELIKDGLGQNRLSVGCVIFYTTYTPCIDRCFSDSQYWEILTALSQPPFNTTWAQYNIQKYFVFSELYRHDGYNTNTVRDKLGEIANFGFTIRKCDGRENRDNPVHCRDFSLTYDGFSFRQSHDWSLKRSREAQGKCCRSLCACSNPTISFYFL